MATAQLPYLGKTLRNWNFSEIIYSCGLICIWLQHLNHTTSSHGNQLYLIKSFFLTIKHHLGYGSNRCILSVLFVCFVFFIGGVVTSCCCCCCCFLMSFSFYISFYHANQARQTRWICSKRVIKGAREILRWQRKFPVLFGRHRCKSIEL